MSSLVSWIMRNRTSAVLAALTTALLSLLLPPLSYLSGAVVGLVTLRHGSREGITVLGLAGLAIAMPALLSGSSGLAIIFGTVVWMPVWVLAVVLRQTVSLSTVLLVAALFGVLCVAIVHGVLTDPVEWWRNKLELLRPLLTEAGWQQQVVDANLAGAAGAMTAMLAGAVMMTPLISLFIARWWQAILYNPGGWRQEFHQLHLPGWLVWVVFAIVASAWFATGRIQQFGADLLVVVVLLYLLQGLSVIHCFVYRLGLSVAWLVGVYALLVGLPQMVMLVAGVGFTDRWLDYRSRIDTADP